MTPVGLVQVLDHQAARIGPQQRRAQVARLGRIAGNMVKRDRAVGRQAGAQRLQPIDRRAAMEDGAEASGSGSRFRAGIRAGRAAATGQVLEPGHPVAGGLACQVTQRAEIGHRAAPGI